MKKTIIIILTAILLAVVGVIGYYIISLSPVSKTGEDIIFTIKSGTSSSSIANSLKEQGLIKNALTFKVYLKLNNKKVQAGTYKLSPTYSVKKITDMFKNGDIYVDSARITFVEGKTLKMFLESYKKQMGFKVDDAIKELSDETYLKELIEKYWFLTNEILDKEIYFPLEGYLFPDTYVFERGMSLKECIEVQLNTLNSKLTPLKDKIEASKLTLHEILTFASIVELEVKSTNDRKLVAGVFYNRLRTNMSLGSCVTTYYAEQVVMGTVDDLYLWQYNAKNAYNTRNTSMKGLPIGPICNPSLDSIKAVLEPTETDYFYFVAVKGETRFAKTYSEHEANMKK